MNELIRELIPHAPQHGLFVAPGIPDAKLRNAVGDFGGPVAPTDVRALYDATLMGSAKDGALFLDDRIVFQNNDLEAPQEVRYADLVAVEAKKKLLGGRFIVMKVNRGRATMELTLDFSGKPDAAEFVERFLNEALLRGAAEEMDRASPADATDVQAVQQALHPLLQRGSLTAEDYDAILALLSRRS